MFPKEEIANLERLLSSAQKILILTHKEPNLDSLGASLGFYLALQKLGKDISVTCPEPLTVEFANLVGIDKISPQLGNQNLEISFPYAEGTIEKVSYNIENGKFNLVIQHQPGAKPLSPETVNYSFSGGNTDLIFVLDTPKLEDLDHLYHENLDLFRQKSVVNIDYHPENNLYGKINFVEPQASSTSEMIGQILKDLTLGFDPDLATNLLTGISWATENFLSPKTTSWAFETAAFCLRTGGKRPFLPPKSAEKKAIGATFKVTSEKKAPATTGEETPPDWLEPKIYKGSTLV